MSGTDKREGERSEYLHVKMTKEEKRNLRVKAAEMGMSMSECVRVLLCQDDLDKAVPA